MAASWVVRVSLSPYWACSGSTQILGTILSNVPPKSFSICYKHNGIGGCVHINPRVTLSGHRSCHIVRTIHLQVLAQNVYRPPKVYIYMM